MPPESVMASPSNRNPANTSRFVAPTARRTQPKPQHARVLVAPERRGTRLERHEDTAVWRARDSRVRIADPVEHADDDEGPLANHNRLADGRLLGEELQREIGAQHGDARSVAVFRVEKKPAASDVEVQEVESAVALIRLCRSPHRRIRLTLARCQPRRPGRSWAPGRGHRQARGCKGDLGSTKPAMLHERRRGLVSGQAAERPPLRRDNQVEARAAGTVVRQPVCGRGRIKGSFVGSMRSVLGLPSFSPPTRQRRRSHRFVDHTGFRNPAPPLQSRSSPPRSTETASVAFPSHFDKKSGMLPVEAKGDAHDGQRTH